MYRYTHSTFEKCTVPVYTVQLLFFKYSYNFIMYIQCQIFFKCSYLGARQILVPFMDFKLGPAIARNRNPTRAPRSFAKYIIQLRFYASYPVSTCDITKKETNSYRAHNRRDLKRNLDILLCGRILHFIIHVFVAKTACISLRFFLHFFPERSQPWKILLPCLSFFYFLQAFSAS